MAIFCGAICELSTSSSPGMRGEIEVHVERQDGRLRPQLQAQRLVQREAVEGVQRIRTRSPAGALCRRLIWPARHQGLVHGFHARAVGELLEEDLVDARIAQQRHDIGPAGLVHVEEIGDGQEHLERLLDEFEEAVDFMLARLHGGIDFQQRMQGQFVSGENAGSPWRPRSSAAFAAGGRYLVLAQVFGIAEQLAAIDQGHGVVDEDVAGVPVDMRQLALSSIWPTMIQVTMSTSVIQPLAWSTGLAESAWLTRVKVSITYGDRLSGHPAARHLVQGVLTVACSFARSPLTK
jgi:hypothetical protein